MLLALHLLLGKACPSYVVDAAGFLSAATFRIVALFDPEFETWCMSVLQFPYSAIVQNLVKEVRK